MKISTKIGTALIIFFLLINIILSIKFYIIKKEISKDTTVKAILTSGDKMLISKSSGKSLDVINNFVFQVSYNTKSSQKWKIQSSGKDYYKIINLGNDKCLESVKEIYNNNYELKVSKATKDDNQKWLIISEKNHFYKIINKATKECLQVNNTNFSVKSNIVTNNTSESWKIEDAYVSDPPHSNTDWLKNAKYGVMISFLPSNKNDLETIVKQFDVNYLADQLQESGAKYLIITLGQNSGYYISPNKIYDDYTGYASGEKCSERDLPLDLYKALSKKGIKLILYLPCQVANRDSRAQLAFGLTPYPSNRPVNIDFAMKWSQVIQEWSDRYGEKISGWWFDGGYSELSFNNEIFSMYSNAAKHGNPKSIVTFNPGVKLIHYSIAEDYTAGETNKPLNVVPKSRFLDGSQLHIITYLDESWGKTTPRYTPNEWSNWIKQVTKKGGVATIDCGPNLNKNKAPIGSLSPEIMAYLKAIKSSIYNN